MRKIATLVCIRKNMVLTYLLLMMVSCISFYHLIGYVEFSDCYAFYCSVVILFMLPYHVFRVQSLQFENIIGVTLVLGGCVIILVC